MLQGRKPTGTKRNTTPPASPAVDEVSLNQAIACIQQQSQSDEKKAKKIVRASKKLLNTLSKDTLKILLPHYEIRQHLHTPFILYQLLKAENNTTSSRQILAKLEKLASKTPKRRTDFQKRNYAQFYYALGLSKIGQHDEAYRLLADLAFHYFEPGVLQYLKRIQENELLTFATHYTQREHSPYTGKVYSALAIKTAKQLQLNEVAWSHTINKLITYPDNNNQNPNYWIALFILSLKIYFLDKCINSFDAQIASQAPCAILLEKCCLALSEPTKLSEIHSLSINLRTHLIQALSRASRLYCHQNGIRYAPNTTAENLLPLNLALSQLNFCCKTILNAYTRFNAYPNIQDKLKRLLFAWESLLLSNVPELETDPTFSGYERDPNLVISPCNRHIVEAFRLIPMAALVNGGFMTEADFLAQSARYTYHAKELAGAILCMDRPYASLPAYLQSLKEAPKAASNTTSLQNEPPTPEPLSSAGNTLFFRKDHTSTTSLQSNSSASSIHSEPIVPPSSTARKKINRRWSLFFTNERSHSKIAESCQGINYIASGPPSRDPSPPGSQTAPLRRKAPEKGASANILH